MSCAFSRSIINAPALDLDLVSGLSAGPQLLAGPLSVWTAERGLPAGEFTRRGGGGGVARQPGGGRRGRGGRCQQVLLLPLQHHLPQPAGRSNTNKPINNYMQVLPIKADLRMRHNSPNV